MVLLDPTRARENVRRHRWAREIVEGWRRDVAYALTRDRGFFESLIPELTPWPEYGQNCPACVGRLSTMGECRLYEWDVTAPDRLTCKYCSTSYPNEEFPETGSITAPVMGQTFTYYLTHEEKAHPEDRSGKYAFRWSRWPVHTSFSGIIRSKKAWWCVGLLDPLAGLYALTGDTACAERAGWILEILASRYPHYLFHSYDGTYADCPPAEAAASMGKHPRGGRFPVETIVSAFEGRHVEGDHAVLNNGFWGAGRLGCSGGDAGLLLRAIMAYDMVRDAGLCEDEGVRDDLILAGCEDMEWWDEINNKCGPGRALSAAVGILFDRPESLRRAAAGLDALMDKGFHFDGFCTESPAYSGMHLNLLRNIPELLTGHTSEGGGDLFEKHPRYRLALESMIRMLDPCMRYPVIGDTRAGAGIQPVHAEVLAAHYGETYAPLLQRSLGTPLGDSGDEYALWHRDPDIVVDPASAGNDGLPLRTEWFPGWQVAVLRGGGAAGHTAFYLNASPFGTHRHYDSLSVIYIAHGKELASDRGYIWDDPRNAWTKSTLAHNLVIVDGQNQTENTEPSSLELFGRGAGVEIAQASSRAYDQCDIYRRTCVLVETGDARTYALDIFRVRGGREHRYCFHCNGQLSGLDGVTPVPVAEEIEWLENLRGGSPRGPWTAHWSFEGVDMDLTLLSPTDRLLVADAPGWRHEGGADMHAPPVQQILAERRGGQGLSSQYVALMAPYEDGSSPILSSEVVANDGETGSCCVAVHREGYTDFIISAPEGGKGDYGPVRMDGRLGFVSVDAAGTPVRGYLLDGTLLSLGEWSLRQPEGRTHLPVAAARERTYRLADPAPGGPPVPGSFLLAGPTGYEIESASDTSITVRDYPVQTCDEVILLHQTEYRRGG